MSNDKKRYVDDQILQENIDITKQRLNAKQPSVLNTPITVLNQKRTTVEDTLQALNRIQRTISWEDYQALSIEEQLNGTEYFIYDLSPDGEVLLVVQTLPATAEDEFTVLYIGETTEDYIKGGIYQYDATNQKWVKISQDGGGGIAYTAGDGIIIDNDNDEIAINPMPASDMDDVVDVLPIKGNLVSIVDAFNKGDLYSTEEKMIGQWIDGKPLYQKTVSTITPSQLNTYTDVISLGSTCVIHFVSGYIEYENDHCIPINIYDGNANHNISVDWGNSGKGNVRMIIGLQYFASKPAIITIQYTKTTDSPVLIGESTDYSTEEKIIGTWVDGKPIYEKTLIILQTISSDTAVTTIDNIEKLVNVFGTCTMSNNNPGVIPWVYTNQYVSIYCQNTNSSIHILTNIGIHDITLILQYTKTTD